MPYVSVPQDLSKVKNKIAMGLTKRQLICFGAATVICVPLWAVTMKPLGDFAIYPPMIVAIPFFLLGFYRGRDNRPPEKIIMNYIRVRFKLPRTRPYRTENTYKKLMLLDEIREVVNENQKDKTA